MLPPEEDIIDRMEIWEAMEIFWLDTDPDIRMEPTTAICARSKYSLEELRQIYWNEVYPALKFNLRSVAGEWIGFQPDFIRERVLEKHRFGKKIRDRFFKKFEREWWEKLAKGVTETRKIGTSTNN